MPLTASEREELVYLDIMRCRYSLTHFIQSAWAIIEPNHSYKHGWHIDAMSEHLAAVISGDIKNLIINIPPRCMKSITVSVMFPAWAWIQKPHLRWLFASYAASLSVRDSLKCRRVIESPWYQARFGHVYRLTSDQNAKAKYENDCTGHRIATSVGGLGTGEGGDVIVVDDPHKISEGESDAVRESTLDWWDHEMASRGNDPKTVAKIVVMQRLHERDLSGHLLRDVGGYEHLCLPAEYDPRRRCSTSIGWSDPREQEGALLWPDRFGVKEVGELKKHLGSQGAAGQLQQIPGPADGNIIKTSWWKRYRDIPDDLTYCIISVDLPYGRTEKSDRAAFQIWGVRGPDRFLLYALAERMAFTQQVDTARGLDRQGWPGCTETLHALVSEVLVENKANGAAMIDVLRAEIPSLHAWDPVGDKKSRAQAMAPSVENGNYWLPEDAVATFDLKGFIHEWAVFPNGSHDDQVDASTQMHLRTKKRLNWGAVTVHSEKQRSQFMM